MRVVISGGTGFIGRHIVRALLHRGDEVAVLTRDTSKPHPGLDARAILLGWDAPSAFAGADAVVNLAGETLAQRWTSKVKERVVASRVEAIEKIGRALRAAPGRPKVVVSASAVGYYGARGEEPLDESAPAGTDFLAGTCLRWEQAARELEPLTARLVVLRIGMVLGRDGGALPRMLPAFRARLGSPTGTGQQFVSFIHVEDLVSLFLFALDDPRPRGALNATAPGPVPMQEFSRALSKAIGRPPLIPSFLGKLGSSLLLPVVLGEMSTLALDGQRAVPARAQALGFSWKFPAVEGALAELLS